MLIRRKKQDNGMFKWKKTENGMPREKTRCFCVLYYDKILLVETMR